MKKQVFLMALIVSVIGILAMTVTGIFAGAVVTVFNILAEKGEEIKL